MQYLNLRGILIKTSVNSGMTICSPWDYHCGWTCMFFTKELNEQALRMGINIIIYYLTH